MRKLPLLLLLLTLACTKPYIYHPVPSKSPVFTLYSIERVAIGEKYATALLLSITNGRAAYQYVDKYNNTLRTGVLPIRGGDSATMKKQVFSALFIEDGKHIVFSKSSDINKYTAFGNAFAIEDDMLMWDGREGGNHLNVGRLCRLKYSILQRQFVSKTVESRSDGKDIRGGSHDRINGIIHDFVALYDKPLDKFLKLLLFKSLDGITSTEETIIHAPGTNNGIDEATHNRFNFYGKPLNIGEEWFVPWYEADASYSPWRTNFLYRANSNDPWVSKNIPQLPTDRIGEHWMEYLGNNTIIALGRKNANTPLWQSVSYDRGNTWSLWQMTNLGSSKGRVMGCIKKTNDYGIVVVYTDRGTGNMMISLNNNESVLTNPLSYNTPTILYTCGSADSFQMLGYPSIEWVSQKTYAIFFSEESSSTNARICAGVGTFEHLL